MALTPNSPSYLWCFEGSPGRRSVLPDSQSRHLGFHGLQHLGIRLGLDPSGFYPFRLVGLGLLARLARGAVSDTGGEDGLALEALVVRDGVRAEFVTGVPVRVLLLLGPVWMVSSCSIG